MNLQQKLYLRVAFGISKKPEITRPIKYRAKAGMFFNGKCYIERMNIFRSY